MKYRCAFAYTMRGAIMVEAENEGEAEKLAESSSLEEINNACREANMDVVIVGRVLSVTDALQLLQQALANYRDGVSPLLVLNGHEIDTIEELKYLVVDPTLEGA